MGGLNFKNFILHASDEAEQAEQDESKDRKKLIRGFYRIVSKKKYDDSEIEDYLATSGYSITTQELRKVRNLHVATDCFFEVHDKDY